MRILKDEFRSSELSCNSLITLKLAYQSATVTMTLINHGTKSLSLALLIICFCCCQWLPM